MKTRDKSSTGGSTPRRGDRARKAPSRYSEFLVAPDRLDDLQAAHDLDLAALCADRSSSWQFSPSSNDTTSNSWAPSVQNSSDEDEETSHVGENAAGSFYGTGARSRRIRGAPRKEKLNAWLANALKQGTPQKSRGRRPSGWRKRGMRAAPGKPRQGKAHGQMVGAGNKPGKMRKKLVKLGAICHANPKDQRTARESKQRQCDDGGAGDHVYSSRASKRQKNRHDHFDGISGNSIEEKLEVVQESSGSDGDILIENTLLDLGGESCLLNPNRASPKLPSDESTDQNTESQLTWVQHRRRYTRREDALHKESLEDSEPSNDLDGNVPWPRHGHKGRRDSWGEGAPEEEVLGEMMTKATRKASATANMDARSQLHRIRSWIEEFKRKAGEGRSENKLESQLVAQLFGHHPELAGLERKKYGECERRRMTVQDRGRLKEVDLGLGDPDDETATLEPWWIVTRSEAVCGFVGYKVGHGKTYNHNSSLHPWLHRIASEVATVSPEKQSMYWQDAQKHILARILTSLPSQFGKLLGRYRNEGSDRARFTSGVSYIVASESMQLGLPAVAPLPHTVIRPPNLEEVTTPSSLESLKTIKFQEVATMILPIRDDNQMKEYFLSPSNRQQIIESNPGIVVSSMKGMGDLSGNLHDRVLVCFHYKLSSSGHLQPCLPHFSTDENAEDDQRSGPGIDESNVQIAVIARKGIGGTCPLRSAARTLETNGILPLLLGSVPQNTKKLPALQPQPVPCYKLPTAVGHTRDNRAAEDETHYIPYRLVKANVKDADGMSVPTVDTASMGEWCDSIRATATHLLSSGMLQAVMEKEENVQCEPDIKDVATDKMEVEAETCDVTEAAPNNADHQSVVDQHEDKQDEVTEEHARGESQSPPKSPHMESGDERARDPEACCSPPREQGAANDESRNSIQELIDGDEAGDEVDELINELKMCENGRDGNSVSMMAMSKLHLYTLSCRLEMFVQGDVWTELTRSQKNELFTVVRGTEAWLASRIKEWNSSRLKDFSECLVAAMNLEPSLSKHGEIPKPVTKQAAERAKTTSASVRETSTKSANEPAAAGPAKTCQDAAPEDDEMADICHSIVDMICPPDDSATADDCPEGADPQEKTQTVDSEENCSLGNQKNEDKMDTSEAEEVDLEDLDGCDFSSEVVKLTASAACLGSMHNFSISDLPWPYYFISTRDCFTYKLLPIQTKVNCANGRSYMRTEFYFQPNELPDDYHQVVKPSINVECIDENKDEAKGADFATPKRIRAPDTKKRPYETPTSTLDDVCFNSSIRGARKSLTSPGGTNPGENGCTPSRTPEGITTSLSDAIPEGAFPVGVTTYTEIFSHEELNAIEAMADAVQEMAQDNELPQECFHETIGRGGSLKRTKYFFGARYLWTREQMADPNFKRASGVRVDVPQRPQWMQALIEEPLVASEIIPQDFINSWALNMYHDGSEGIQSHFDDSVRFLRPIYSLRLFSDSRLSFGTQLYGYTNGAFYIPMPRGCITVMEEGSYAADGVKHCVRPMDMQGKNAGLIMRQINPEAMLEAWKYHLEESSLWLKSLSLEDDAVPFKERLCRVVGDEPSGRNVDEGTVANICRKILYRCIKKIEKEHRNTASEVRSVMESLIRGVVRGIHQDDIQKKRRNRQEHIMVKHVLDGIVRKIEHQARVEQRQQRQQKVLEAQVRSVTESIIRRLERTEAESRKRRLHAAIQGERRKRSMTESLMAARSRDNKANKAMLKAASDVIREVASCQPAMFQAAQELLQKFGASWLRALKQKQDQSGATLNSNQSPTDNNLSSKAVKSTPFHFPPVVLPAVPENYETAKSGRGSAEKGSLGSEPRSLHRDFLRVIPVPMPSKLERPNAQKNSDEAEVSQEDKVKSGSTSPQQKDGKDDSEVHETVGEAQEHQPDCSSQNQGEDKPPASDKGPDDCKTIIPESNTLNSDEATAQAPVNPVECGDEEKEEVDKDSRQKALVKSLTKTILKAVIHLAVDTEPTEEKCDDKGGHGKAAKMELLEKAEELLKDLDLDGARTVPMTVAVKPVVVHFPDRVTKGMEEGKRRYNLVPWCVCFECEEQGVDPSQPPRGKSAPLPSDDTLLWQCRGKCRKSFHFKCRPPPKEADDGQCSRCASENHCCLICGEDGFGDAGKVVKCSMGVCGKFYHPQCVFANPITNVLQGTWIPVGSVEGDKTGMRFRCPQHYCRTCGLSGANIYSVTCIRCPNAYHSRCCPPGCKKLSKKLVLCAEHEPKGRQ